MANNQSKQNQDNGQVVEAASRVELFLKKYESLFTWVIVGIVAVALGIYAFNRWVAEPARETARAQMFTAETYFRAEDYSQALNGDGNALGFAQVIDQFGAKAGQAAYMYAGICELQLGNFQEAISYLKKYNGRESVTKARALCCIGDAYVGLGNNSEALVWYNKAIAASDNDLTAKYMLKAGLVCEELGDNDGAVEFYEKIKVLYPASYEAYDIDKYISRIK